MSAPTVSGLCATLGAHLRPGEGFVAPDSPVSAVHISELLDPSPYLSGGELLLTTGLSMPRSRIGCDAYVTRLVRAGVAALGIGLGPVHQTPPEQLVGSCRRHGLTLLVVPAPTPFLTISKAYWSAVARSGERVLSDALAVQQALVDATASPEPVPVVLRRLAEAVDGWAAVLSPDGVVEEVHPASRIEEATELQREVGRLASAGARSAASFGTADRTVVVYPMTVDVQPVGYLAVGSRSKPTAATRRTILAAAALLSLVISYGERLRASAAAGRTGGRDAVAALLELDHPEAAREVAETLGQPPVPARGRLLAVRSSTPATVDAVLDRDCPDRHGRWVDATTGWFLLPAPTPDQRVVSDLTGADRDGAGVLAPATSTADLALAVRRCLSALAAVPSGEWRIAAGPAATGNSEVDAAVDGAVVALTARATPEVVTALVAYLRHRGRWEAAARELDLHRNTLRHRVGRAAALLRLDLDDPDVAARLWLALRERVIA